jgi:hypothetical protein
MLHAVMHLVDNQRISLLRDHIIRAERAISDNVDGDVLGLHLLAPGLIINVRPKQVSFRSIMSAGFLDQFVVISSEDAADRTGWR